VTVAAPAQDFLIDTTSGIANRDTQIAWIIADFDLDLLGARVTECIRERFAADPVHFIAYQRIQLPASPDHDNSETSGLRYGQFLTNIGRGPLEIIGPRRGRSKTPNRIPAVVNHLLQHSNNGEN
jgi:hypothetical protein